MRPLLLLMCLAPIAWAEIKPVMRYAYVEGSLKNHDVRIRVISPTGTLGVIAKKTLVPIDLSETFPRNAVRAKEGDSDSVVVHFGDLDNLEGSLLQCNIEASLGGQRATWEVATHKDTSLVSGNLRIEVTGRKWAKIPSVIDQINQMKFYDERTAPNDCGSSQYIVSDSASAQTLTQVRWLEIGKREPTALYRFAFKKSVIPCQAIKSRKTSVIGFEVDPNVPIDFGNHGNSSSHRRQISVQDEGDTVSIYLTATVDELPSTKPRIKFSGTLSVKDRAFTVTKNIPVNSTGESCDTFQYGKLCWTNLHPKH